MSSPTTRDAAIQLALDEHDWVTLDFLESDRYTPTLYQKSSNLELSYKGVPVNDLIDYAVTHHRRAVQRALDMNADDREVNEVNPRNER